MSIFRGVFHIPYTVLTFYDIMIIIKIVMIFLCLRNFYFLT